jgi:hypothetical protein
MPCSSAAASCLWVTAAHTSAVSSPRDGGIKHELGQLRRLLLENLGDEVVGDVLAPDFQRPRPPRWIRGSSQGRRRHLQSRRPPLASPMEPRQGSSVRANGAAQQPGTRRNRRESRDAVRAITGPGHPLAGEDAGPVGSELAGGSIGSARVTAFGVSNVAPSGAVVGGLVIVEGYAGFAAPLVVLIALVASLCCAVSIAEFARRLPSAGSLYTYTFGYLAGAAGLSVVLIYLAVNLSAIRAFRTGFRSVQGLVSPGHLSGGRRFLFVPPLGDPAPARPGSDGPAAVHGSRLARPRPYRRWRSASPPAGPLRGAGQGFPAGRR